jgi:hypothetical protein
MRTFDQHIFHVPRLGGHFKVSCAATAAPAIPTRLGEAKRRDAPPDFGEMLSADRGALYGKPSRNRQKKTARILAF